MVKPSRKVDLLAFTVDSLSICGTKLRDCPPERILTTANDLYMPLIANGWAVPLAFILDVSNMLLTPNAAFEKAWVSDVRDEFKQLFRDYYRMLIGMRRQPTFASVVQLINPVENGIHRRILPEARNQITKTFLRFLLAELSQFRHTYSFNTRELKFVRAARRRGAVLQVKVACAGQTRDVNISLAQPTQHTPSNEFGTLFNLMRTITDYYSTHPLEKFISPEERLMVQIAACNPRGIGRVDYRFLQELLQDDVEHDVEEEKPRPHMVDKIVPTDSYEIDGSVGGYIDVNRRRFSGGLAEMLPAELALFRHRHLMVHKLLNESALHFVRENIECIEEELRVLVCLVVDVDERMLRSPPNVHAKLGQGLTPYIRARALAALMIKDLARFMPREKVRLDCALYLWSPGTKASYRKEVVDLFSAWSRDSTANAFSFGALLAAHVPPLFENRLGHHRQDEARDMDRDPSEFVRQRSKSRTYHCRHLVYLTSRHSAERLAPANDPGLFASQYSGDSITVVCCDVDRRTVGVSFPQSVRSAFASHELANQGELNDERLRARFLYVVISKAARKIVRAQTSDLLSDL